MIAAKVGAKVTIVGAGFSGLATAYYLSRAGFQVEVIEEKSRVGGLINTIESSFGLVETAANGLLNSGEVEDLFTEINLDFVPTLKTSRRRYVFRRGRPSRWPVGLNGTLSIAKFVLCYVFARSSLAPHPEETLREWGLRTLGADATESFVEAGIQGIYAGDSSRMSASLVVGSLFKPKASHRRLKLKGTVAPVRGMSELMFKLRVHLDKSGVRFRLGEKYQLSTPPSHPVVIATSSEAASEILRPLDSSRAQALSEIELLPIVTATAFFTTSLPKSQCGFGCLFPPIEKRPMLGVLMNSFIFPNRSKDSFSETWIFGGATNPSVAAKSVSEISAIICSERQKVFGASGDLLHAEVTIRPRALPHYTVALEKQLPVLKKEKFNVFLIGNYLGEIGLARILAQARRLSANVAEKGRWNE